MGKKHKLQVKARKTRLAKKLGLKKGEFVKPKGIVPKNLQGPKQSNKTGGAGGGGKSGLAETYKPNERILLVGEANFSFARALVRRFGGNAPNLVASNLDSEEKILQKYDDTPKIVEEIEDGQVDVRYGVDARNLAGDLKLAVGGKKRMRKGRTGDPLATDAPAGEGEEPWRFHKVVFNFPHCGLGIKDQHVNIQKNKEMLAAFFPSALGVLRKDGEVHVAVKLGEPYTKWNVCGVAHASSGKRLKLKTSYRFGTEAFDGYAHRRTLGFSEGLSAGENEEIGDGARTYCWNLVDPENI